MTNQIPTREEIPAAQNLADDDRVNAAEQGEGDTVIDAEVAAAPPLRPEQIARLAALFDYQPGQGGDDDA